MVDVGGRGSKGGQTTHSSILSGYRGLLAPWWPPVRSSFGRQIKAHVSLIMDPSKNVQMDPAWFIHDALSVSPSPRIGHVTAETAASLSWADVTLLTLYIGAFSAAHCRLVRVSASALGSQPG